MNLQRGAGRETQSGDGTQGKGFWKAVSKVTPWQQWAGGRRKLQGWMDEVWSIPQGRVWVTTSSCNTGTSPHLHFTSGKTSSVQQPDAVTLLETARSCWAEHGTAPQRRIGHMGLGGTFCGAVTTQRCHPTSQQPESHQGTPSDALAAGSHLHPPKIPPHVTQH